jgi:hypothetical protein
MMNLESHISLVNLELLQCRIFLRPIGVVSGIGAALEGFETPFHQDLCAFRRFSHRMKLQPAMPIVQAAPRLGHQACGQRS